MNDEVIKLAKELKNIGPKNAQRLLAIGVDSKERLIDKWVYETYIEILESDLYYGTPHPAYLYALYGAVHNIDWKKIPEEKKEEYKKFVRDLKTSM